MQNSIELKFVPIGGVYNVELRGGIVGQPATVTIDTNIPAFDPQQYYAYQATCRELSDRVRLGVKSTNVVTSADLAKIRDRLAASAADVIDALDRWTQLSEFAKIAAEIERRSENLQVTISTDDLDLRRQPWHESRLFPPQTEVIFSGIEAKVLERTRHPEKIRILVILGNDTGISEGIKKDRAAIEEYCERDAELAFLTQPTKSELTVTLADPDGWDIIFFSGHSDTNEQNVGKIHINATESLTMAELTEVLAPAIANRIQIAIFNSCDGLGITPVLEKLNIDRLIVMREPIPDEVAHQFLKKFLRAFTWGARFDDAVKIARQQLVEVEDRYPYASWLPIVIQNRLVSSPTWQSLGKIRSPYKGLAAFTEADADNFYGREETIERYAQLVDRVPLVPIIGASGSGKSSLVQAGLIPYLKQDSASNWQILTMRPGRNPFAALARAIAKVERANLETIQLDVHLAGDRHLLTQKLAQILLPQHRLLLFIDQFEELFTQSDDRTTQQVFLQSLADAIENAPNFVLVFTLRNDFLPTLQSDRQDNDFRQVLERYGFQSIGSMSRDRLRAAISKPVERLGVEFEGGLVDRLLQDVGTKEGSLPLLQLVLDLLWQNVQKRQLTHTCYEALGGQEGMKTVLVKLADDVYSNFAKQGNDREFKQVFLQLVSLGDVNATLTRRIATRQEIGEANWQKIVEPLSAARLLKPDLNDRGEEIVEVIHETLIQSWQRLTAWIDKHRHDLEQIGEIEAAAIKWQRNRRSKEDLWRGKKLKEARKFSTALDPIVPLPQVVDDFLVAGRKQSRKQQRWSIGWLVLLGALLAVLVGNQFRQAALREAYTLANSARAQLDRGQRLDGLVTAIKAGKILQAQQASDPDLVEVLRKALNHSNERYSLKGGSNVSISPDGKTLAANGDDNTIKVWDLATGKEIRTLKGHKEVTSVSISPDGKTLASGSWDKTIKLWDLTTGKELHTLLGHKLHVYSVSISPDGKTLASGGGDKTIKLWDLATGKELHTLLGHKKYVGSVSFSPDGKTLASGGGDNQPIKVWDLATGKEIRTLKGHQDQLNSISFSPDGKTLASGGCDNTVKLWDLATGKEIRTLKGHQKGLQSCVWSVSFSPDGKTLASGGGDNTIKLWDLATGKELHTLLGHKEGVSNVSFSPDGKTLASSDGNNIKVWGLATDREIHTLLGHKEGVNRVIFSPDGKTLASGSSDTIKVWDVATGIETLPVKGHRELVYSHYISPDGKTEASGNIDGTIKVRDVATGKELHTLKGHQEFVSSVSISPNGKTLASGSWDKTIGVWDLATGKELHTLLGHQEVTSVSISPDGKTLASGSWDNTIKLWDLATGKELHTLLGHQESVYSMSISPDGKTLASGSGDNTIKLWDLATGKELHTLLGHQKSVNSVSISPDGKTLASSSSDKTIKLWDLATGKELHTLKGHQEDVSRVIFSPDGKTLASGSGGIIKVWDVATGKEIPPLKGHRELVYQYISPDGKTEASVDSDNTIKVREVTGKELHTLKGHQEGVSSVSISPDGKTLASGSWDKTIKLWDLATGKELHTLLGHQEGVRSVSISPDGKILASGSGDKTIKQWDLATGKELHTLKGHQDAVNSVSISPDGKILASGSEDKTIKLWDLATGKELHTLKGHQEDVNSVSFSPDGKILASGSRDKTIKLWRSSNWNFDDLMERSCDWARAYIASNPNVSNSDRNLCDGISAKKQ